jgi:aconitate hydratase
MERFGVPGKTLLGADSHTPGAAGVSMLGIGAGGLDVALAMAGYPYYLTCPEVLGVKLTGKLPDWVSAKDVILEMLRRYDVKGCLGKIIEYYGPGVKTLSATDRETIGNMGTETGATTSIFPSDERTREYLIAQGRGDAWVPLAADEGASYDEYAEIDLSKLEPLIATPSSPECCSGGSRRYESRPGDRGKQCQFLLPGPMVAARMLEGRRVYPGTSFHEPGSRQSREH